MKYLVPYYSCLQNLWLGGCWPQIPILSVLCPQLNLLNPARTKIPGHASVFRQYKVCWRIFCRLWSGRSRIWGCLEGRSTCNLRTERSDWGCLCYRFLSWQQCYCTGFVFFCCCSEIRAEVPATSELKGQFEAVCVADSFHGSIAPAHGFCSSVAASRSKSSKNIHIQGVQRGLQSKFCGLVESGLGILFWTCNCKASLLISSRMHLKYFLPIKRDSSSFSSRANKLLFKSWSNNWLMPHFWLGHLKRVPVWANIIV